jgi:8-oxo-dGTP pyrophosphatase MutT (NUDIX family)
VSSSDHERCLLTRFLHLGVNAFQVLRRCVWFLSRPRTVGVHGIPLTQEGKVVLVTLSYATGWRLPGGGRKAAEEPRQALLRELREEIGLTGHTSIELVGDFRHQPDFRRGEASLFVVRGVQYRPRWSWEVATVGEFDLDELPPETARITHQLLALASRQLP